jgi:hypothetical protein
LLGKNGEPKTNYDIELIFFYVLTSYQKTLSVRTDDKYGSVRLGPLHNVTRVSASVAKYGDIVALRRVWDLDERRSRVNYPSKLVVCEGEEIMLPYAQYSDTASNQQ